MEEPTKILKNLKQPELPAKTLNEEEELLKAGNGDVNALFSLGRYYEQGKGTKKSIKKAVKYYEQASDAGCLEAKYYLAQCYERGKLDFDADGEAAFELYEEAAKANYPPALYRLARCYEEGFLGEYELDVDVNEALTRYIKAAEAGYANAQYRLGELYEKGKCGLRENSELALKWYQAAAAQGHKQAVSKLKTYSESNLDIKEKSSELHNKDSKLDQHKVEQLVAVNNNSSLATTTLPEEKKHNKKNDWPAQNLNFSQMNPQDFGGLPKNSRPERKNTGIIENVSSGSSTSSTSMSSNMGVELLTPEQQNNLKFLGFHASVVDKQKITDLFIIILFSVQKNKDVNMINLQRLKIYDELEPVLGLTSSKILKGHVDDLINLEIEPTASGDALVEAYSNIWERYVRVSKEPAPAIQQSFDRVRLLSQYAIKSKSGSGLPPTTTEIADRIYIKISNEASKKAPDHKSNFSSSQPDPGTSSSGASSSDPTQLNLNAVREGYISVWVGALRAGKNAPDDVFIKSYEPTLQALGISLTNDEAKELASKIIKESKEKDMKKTLGKDADSKYSPVVTTTLYEDDDDDDQGYPPDSARIFGANSSLEEHRKKIGLKTGITYSIAELEMALREKCEDELRLNSRGLDDNAKNSYEIVRLSYPESEYKTSLSANEIEAVAIAEITKSNDNYPPSSSPSYSSGSSSTESFASSYPSISQNSSSPKLKIKLEESLLSVTGPDEKKQDNVEPKENIPEAIPLLQDKLKIVSEFQEKAKILLEQLKSSKTPTVNLQEGYPKMVELLAQKHAPVLESQAEEIRSYQVNIIKSLHQFRETHFQISDLINQKRLLIWDSTPKSFAAVSEAKEKLQLLLDFTSRLRDSSPSKTECLRRINDNLNELQKFLDEKKQQTIPSNATNFFSQGQEQQSAFSSSNPTLVAPYNSNLLPVYQYNSLPTPRELTIQQKLNKHPYNLKILGLTIGNELSIDLNLITYQYINLKFKIAHGEIDSATGLDLKKAYDALKTDFQLDDGDKIFDDLVSGLKKLNLQPTNTGNDLLAAYKLLWEEAIRNYKEPDAWVVNLFDKLQLVSQLKLNVTTRQVSNEIYDKVANESYKEACDSKPNEGSQSLDPLKSPLINELSHGSFPSVSSLGQAQSAASTSLSNSSSSITSFTSFPVSSQPSSSPSYSSNASSSDQLEIKNLTEKQLANLKELGLEIKNNSSIKLHEINAQFIDLSFKLMKDEILPPGTKDRGKAYKELQHELNLVDAEKIFSDVVDNLPESWDLKQNSAEDTVIEAYINVWEKELRKSQTPNEKIQNSFRQLFHQYTIQLEVDKVIDKARARILASNKVTDKKRSYEYKPPIKVVLPSIIFELIPLNGFPSTHAQTDMKESQSNLIQAAKYPALAAAAQEYKLTLEDVDDDGDCLFRAISIQLERYGVEISAKNLRLIAMEQMKSFPDLYANFISQGSDYSFRHLKETLEKNKDKLENAFTQIRSLYGVDNMPLAQIYENCCQNDNVGKMAAGIILEDLRLTSQEIVEAHVNSMLEHLGNTPGKPEKPKWADQIDLKAISDALGMSILCLGASDQTSSKTLHYYAQKTSEGNKQPLIIGYNGQSHYLSLSGDAHLILTAREISKKDSTNKIVAKEISGNASKPLTKEELEELAKQETIDQVARVFRIAKQDDIAKANKPEVKPLDLSASQKNQQGDEVEEWEDLSNVIDVNNLDDNFKKATQDDTVKTNKPEENTDRRDDMAKENKLEDTPNQVTASFSVNPSAIQNNSLKDKDEAKKVVPNEIALLEKACEDLGRISNTLYEVDERKRHEPDDQTIKMRLTALKTSSETILKTVKENTGIVKLFYNWNEDVIEAFKNRTADEIVLQTIEERFEKLKSFHESFVLDNSGIKVDLVKVQKVEREFELLFKIADLFLGSSSELSHLKDKYLILRENILEKVRLLREPLSSKGPLKGIELIEREVAEAKQIKLGCAYETGNVPGIEKDMKKAFKEFKSFADKNNTTAQFYLAKCFQDGRGVTKNLRKAIEYYEKIKNDNAYVEPIIKELEEAEVELGLAYQFGTKQGIPIDRVKAFNEYQSMANQGNKIAQFLLARCYQYGIGTTKDLSEAVERYENSKGNYPFANKEKEEIRRALTSQYDVKRQGIDMTGVFKVYQSFADRGNITAQYMVAECYQYGKGVTKDLSKAAEWYEKTKIIYPSAKKIIEKSNASESKKISEDYNSEDYKAYVRQKRRRDGNQKSATGPHQNTSSTNQSKQNNPPPSSSVTSIHNSSSALYGKKMGYYAQSGEPTKLLLNQLYHVLNQFKELKEQYAAAMKQNMVGASGEEFIAWLKDSLPKIKEYLNLKSQEASPPQDGQGVLSKKISEALKIVDGAEHLDSNSKEDITPASPSSNGKKKRDSKNLSGQEQYKKRKINYDDGLLSINSSINSTDQSPLASEIPRSPSFFESQTNNQNNSPVSSSSSNSSTQSSSSSSTGELPLTISSTITERPVTTPQ